MYIVGWGILGILHLHEGAFQMLAYKERGFVTLPSGDITASRVAEVGVVKLTCTRTYRPRAGRK